MVSIKSWFTTTKPQQSQQPTPHQITETKNGDCQTPIVRSAFQPARIPRNGLPSTTSIRTSLEIRKRDSTVPAKRAAEVDEPSDDVARKLPRLESPSPAISSNSYEDKGHDHGGGEGAEALPKRLRADNVSEDESPTKKRKTELLKGSGRVESSHKKEALPSVERESTEDVSTERSSISTSKRADDYPKSELYVDDDEVFDRRPPRLNRPERLSSLKPPRAMRGQLQAYFKSRTVSQKSVTGSKDSMSGVGSWAGSEIIPGSRKRIESDANSIELPRKGSRRSKSSKTPDSFEFEDDANARSKGRGKMKAADVPGQVQMRLHRPWRLYDEESLELDE